MTTTHEIHNLRKFTEGTLDWIIQNLMLFDPFVKGLDDPLHNKAFIELALLCMCYKRGIRKNLDPRINTLISFIYRVWSNPIYQECIVRKPERHRMYALVYVCLENYGFPDQAYREIIQRAFNQGYVSSIEEIPYRYLDLRHVLDCGGFKHDLPSYDLLYQKTLLAKKPSLLYLNDYDLYCITHTIFYLSDFGSRPIDVIPDEQLPIVRWMVGALLGMYLRLQNWDLVSELLMSCLCLRWYPPIVFDVSWKALLNAQMSDGSIPGPYFLKEKNAKLDKLKQTNYCFEQNYHTTLVAAMASFLKEV